MAHEHAVYFTCQGNTEASGSKARLAQGLLGNQSPCKEARQQKLPKPVPLGHLGTWLHTHLCSFPLWMEQGSSCGAAGNATCELFLEETEKHSEVCSL